GAPEGGESHFRVRIVSPSFEGQTRVARQRAVNAALKEELAGRVHALSVQALAPGET
ncbi:MAG: BolA family protein, partial [Pseudomonadota bacterium]